MKLLGSFAFVIAGGAMVVWGFWFRRHAERLADRTRARSDYVRSLRSRESQARTISGTGVELIVGGVLIVLLGIALVGKSL